MSQAVRAVYYDGNLRLLDPVTLRNGEEISLVIFSEVEQAIAALQTLLIQVSPPDDDMSDDDAALAALVARGFASLRPLSEALIEARREQP